LFIEATYSLPSVCFDLQLIARNDGRAIAPITPMHIKSNKHPQPLGEKLADL
jgi:hypothetical protein